MIDAENIVQAATGLFKQKLSENLQNLDPASSLTAALADDFGKDIKTIACQAAAEGIRQFLIGFDELHDTLIVDGHTYYPGPEQEDKILMTIADKIVLPRWAYQSNTCNRMHIPLDLKCGIDGEFAMPAVREALLYINSELSPRSVEAFLKKVGTFQISHTANENIIKEFGEAYKEHAKEIIKSAREADELPGDTHVIAISLDGANVRLNEPGPKRGRPDERPDKQENEELEPTCFKNAMVGTFAYFGEIAEDKHSPGYLHQTCIAQMPEDRFLTFKERFEEEVDHCLELCATSNRPIDRLMLLGGGTNLHGYLDKNPALKSLPRLIDFFRSTEHLGKAAEALFGKKSKTGRKWVETYRHILKTDVNGVTKLPRSLAYYKRKQKLSKQRQKDLDTEITYFRRGGKYMTSADFRARGWPIGSGVG